jgi:hypothetical protein
VRGEGVGFRFAKYKPDSLWRALMKALALFNQPEIWRQIMQNGMARDFSWKSSALEYLELYEKALAEKQRAAGSGQRAEVRGQKAADAEKKGESQIRNPKSEARNKSEM